MKYLFLILIFCCASSKKDFKNFDAKSKDNSTAKSDALIKETIDSYRLNLPFKAGSCLEKKESNEKLFLSEMGKISFKAFKINKEMKITTEESIVFYIDLNHYSRIDCENHYMQQKAASDRFDWSEFK